MASNYLQSAEQALMLDSSDYAFRWNSVQLLASTTQKILPINPRRFWVSLVCLTASGCFVWWDSTVTNTRGFPVIGNIPISWYYSEVGSFVQQEWWLGGTTVNVFVSYVEGTLL